MPDASFFVPYAGMQILKFPSDMIDLRSDTVTKPTPEMLEYMTRAEVGDDVFEEDTSINRLQDKIAELFGMEAGLFVPSGTMSNQLGIKVLTEPGDELLIEKTGHIFNYESAAAGMLSGVLIHPVAGKNGKLRPEDIHDTIRGKYDWEARTKVLCLENTTNKGGGACYSEAELTALKTFADENGLKVHLDGARIWNAMTATGVKPSFFGTVSDTLSVCFSKGLGAPVGSMLLASAEQISAARRFRKMWGGGMRQAGLLAAAADYAIENHWPLLAEDHRRARELAAVIDGCRGLAIDLQAVETNILIFDVLDETSGQALEKLSARGVRMTAFGPKTLRATFHFQIDDEALETTKNVISELFG